MYAKRFVALPDYHTGFAIDDQLVIPIIRPVDCHLDIVVFSRLGEQIIADLLSDHRFILVNREQLDFDIVSHFARLPDGVDFGFHSRARR